MKSCDTCAAAGTMVSGDKSLQRICRKKPPVVYAVPIQVQPGTLSWATCTAWPQIDASHWCDEYSPTVVLS